MGLRKDLDRVKERYIYFLEHQETVLYVGTSVNPKGRYRKHLKSIADGSNAPIYAHCRNNGLKPTLRVVSKIVSTYADAEVIETRYIKENPDCLNYYGKSKQDKKTLIEKVFSVPLPQTA